MKQMEKIDNIKIYNLEKGNESTEELLYTINELLKILDPEMENINKKRFLKLMGNPLFELYLLEIADEVVGMASLHYMETLAKKSTWVEDVVVFPRYQGKGLGKKLMKHIIEEAKKHGVKHIDLTSSPHRIAANELYKKLGFEPRNTNVYRLKI